MTDGKIKTPLMGYGMVIDNGTVQKTIRSNRSDLMKHLNFGAYLTKIFKHE